MKMATKKEIEACFQELNVVTSDTVLDKCLELCLNYNIGAEEFCDQWYAYTASNLSGATPTVEHLEKLERKEYKKNKDQSYNAKQVLSKSALYKSAEDLDANTIISSYTATTPKSNRIQPKTPLQEKKKQNITFAGSNSNGSPSTSQSEKYTQRSDSRAVQCYYGPPTAQYKREEDYPISINHVNEEQILNSNIKYMYEIMGKKAKCLNSMTQWLGHAILEKHNLTLTEGTLKTHLGEMTTYGRIVSDSDGKINVQSVLLEGSRETNLGNTINLNLNKVPKFSLFPGQVAVVQGNNLNSSTFIAEKIFTESLLPLPAEVPVTHDPIQIVVASGPYTLQSNLSYEPLKDLLKYVSEYKPHVLILFGPFLEKNHEGIHNGSLLQTFDSFFESLIENIMISLQNINVEVVIVSSQKDAHHHPVYPTPPYSTRERYNNLTFVPDPCMININGLVIGATSVDALFHISNFEIYQDKNPSGPSDRMGRIASHLLNQHSFYPLYPPPKEMSVDHELFEQYGVLECKPHILILPSNLRHFIKNIQDCLVINPERLTKGYVAGTFARIEISPGSSKSICNRSACQIVRV